MNQSYISLIGLIIAIIGIGISILNYKLNKTLNIKNQLYNEKFKQYRLLTKALSELITLIEKFDNIFSLKDKNLQKAENQLIELAVEVDNKCYEIDYLFTEAHLIVPDNILKLLDDLSEYLIHSNIDNPESNFEKVYRENEDKIRDIAKNLILSFRKDLGIIKLNLKF